MSFDDEHSDLKAREEGQSQFVETLVFCGNTFKFTFNFFSAGKKSEFVALESVSSSAPSVLGFQFCNGGES